MTVESLEKAASLLAEEMVLNRRELEEMMTATGCGREDVV